MGKVIKMDFINLKVLSFTVIGKRIAIPRAYRAAEGGEKVCNGHGTYVDSKILNVTQPFNEQASISMVLWQPTATLSFCI